MLSVFRKSLHQTVKSFSVHNKNNSVILKGTARMISTSENLNSSVFAKKDKISANEFDQRNKLKQTIRTLSTLNHSVPLPATRVSSDEHREMMAVFPDFVRDLTELTSKYDSNFAPKRMERVLQYNALGGKLNRGLTIVNTYKYLIDPSQLTPENVRLAYYLGWCVESVQGVFLIADDIIDGGTTRRGQPCWHTLKDVGIFAINDIVMIENGIYHILKKYFGSTEYYVKLIELFRKVTFISMVGQSSDFHMSNKDVSQFPMEKYITITNKTVYYTGFVAAMHMAGFTDPEVFRQVETFLQEMGRFYQIQDDYFDSFGDPAITGKIGTDIQNNKCSWLAVVCMKRASSDQKKIMKECYGQKDPVKVARVKELYKELGIPNAYAVYEEESYNRIKKNIQQTSTGVLHDIFLKHLDKIYKRDS